MAVPPSVLWYAPWEATATPSVVTGWLPPKTTQVPFPRTPPPAQKVLESTSIVRSGMSTCAGYCVICAIQLTLIAGNVVLDRPCWVGTVLARYRDRVVLRLVQDVNLVLVAKEHLTLAQDRQAVSPLTIWALIPIESETDWNPNGCAAEGAWVCRCSCWLLSDSGEAAMSWREARKGRRARRVSALIDILKAFRAVGVK